MPFNPNQARVPAGSTHGGEFGKSSGGVRTPNEQLKNRSSIKDSPFGNLDSQQIIDHLKQSFDAELYNYQQASVTAAEIAEARFNSLYTNAGDQESNLAPYADRLANTMNNVVASRSVEQWDELSDEQTKRELKHAAAAELADSPTHLRPFLHDADVVADFVDDPAELLRKGLRLDHNDVINYDADWDSAVESAARKSVSSALRETPQTYRGWVAERSKRMAESLMMMAV